ncbi:GNAT family N-acetyltransferase [Ideonella sp. DXS29W]|uniref:GNAT family N-acetyltransferase n=1 Tax=Ideonella lacteola TaxID=2984193 RepID=A0ABU9BSW0_9BURK
MSATREFLIRSGEAGDAHRLAVLATQVWLHTYAVDGISDLTAHYILSEITPEKYAQALAEPSVHFLVAEREGCLIGFAKVRLTTPCPSDGVATSAELQTLYVQEHYIGRGLGRRLLQAAEALAREHSEPRLWLTVNAKNQRALRFYARVGYAKVGTAYFVLGDERHENHVLVGGAA